MEAVRAMLHDQDLPMYIWVKATRIVVYVQNRISHSALGNMTPKEKFTGKKPEVSLLKIFGCPVFVHIPKDKRSKLDPSGKKGVFVGYSESSKAYKVYIPGFHNIESSRDVTFDEDAAFSRSRKTQEEDIHEEEPIAPRVAPSKEAVHEEEVQDQPDTED